MTIQQLNCLEVGQLVWLVATNSSNAWLHVVCAVDPGREEVLCAAVKSVEVAPLSSHVEAAQDRTWYPISLLAFGSDRLRMAVTK